MAALLPEHVAYDALRRAYTENRIVFFTDPQVLNRPGSPVYSAIDVFAPPLVMMGGSLTLLFAFGLLEWMIALLFVLAYQLYGAKYLVEWRMHRRTVKALMRHPYNLSMLWKMGGIAIALREWPERNCVAPQGDWRHFVGDWLMEADENTEHGSGTAAS